jgi:hypothetical protein
MPYFLVLLFRFSFSFFIFILIETLNGITTIRSFEMLPAFIFDNDYKIDRNMKANFVVNGVSRWYVKEAGREGEESKEGRGRGWKGRGREDMSNKLCNRFTIRLEMMCALTVTLATFFCIVQRETISPGTLNY